MNKRFAFIFLSLFLQAIVDGAPDPKANETSPDEGNESGMRHPDGCRFDSDCIGRYPDDDDRCIRYVCRYNVCLRVDPPRDVCKQKFACPGGCWMDIPSWSYNQATKRCEKFTYGGCKGNQNRFKTYGECQQRCGGGCLPGAWKCRNGQCIAEPTHCDGKPDCRDGSDERGCSRCNHGLFTCNKIDPGFHLNCIPLSQKCDGKPDCKSGYDEDPSICRGCRHNEFRCKNGQCIKKWLKCNGVADCYDGSDECDCPPVPPPHPDPDHMCRCINPFHDHRPEGDPEWLCRTKGLCYVNCDLSCSDEEKSKNVGRCESKYACNKNKLGEEKGKKEEKNDLKYLEKGKKDEE